MIASIAVFRHKSGGLEHIFVLWGESVMFCGLGQSRFMGRVSHVLRGESVMFLEYLFFFIR